MKTLLILLIITSNALMAIEPIHSSVSAYYENKSFSSSVQKTDGVVYGIAADIHHNASEYKFAYEYGDTRTKQPPLPDDLHTDKLFLRYAHNLNEKFSINVNHINILNDNLAITDEGKAYGFGLSYKYNKAIATNFTQFYTKYNDFEVYQSDLRVDFKFKVANAKIKLSSISKFIKIGRAHV